MSDNKLGNINYIDDGENLLIQSDEDMFVKSFHFNQFYEDAVYKRFIKNVERLIRMSKEYKEYMNNLRETINPLGKDAVLGNITSADATIEFHHYPFTLYDLVEITMNYNSLNKIKFTSFSLAKAVLEDHFDNIIGLVPLSTTLHEMAHSGDIFLSTHQVFGNVESYIKKYDKCIPGDLLQKYQTLLEHTESNLPTDTKGLL